MEEFEIGILYPVFSSLKRPTQMALPDRTDSAGTGSAPETDSAPDLGRRFVVSSLGLWFFPIDQ
jgi:hypothetical protein